MLEQHISRRSLWLGALWWIAFSVVAVILRGVRWEETYEHALVITGAVPYPDGHPILQYCRNVFSGQSYLSALVLHLIDSPLLLNGYRNVLQLIFCTVPVMLLGARFTGRVAFGHVAVVFVLLGIHRGLQSYYPIESWPHMYAVGQIGTGYALLVLALLLFDCWRTVWLLLGLMVAVHIGQLPVIGAVAGMQWLVYLFRGDRKRVRLALGYFAVGLVPCVIFYLVRTQLYVPMPETGAYAAEGDVQAIWAAYTERRDLHRGFARLNPFWKSWIGVGLVLGILGLRARIEWNGPQARVYTWSLTFSVVLAVVVGTIWSIHQTIGSNVPFLLIGWMPYRLTNHLAVLLVPAALGLLLHGTPPKRAGDTFVSCLLLYAVSLPALALVVPESLFVPYLGNLDTLLFLLSGGALGAAVVRQGPSRTNAVVAGMLCLGAVAIVAGFSPYAALCIFAGALAAGGLFYIEQHLPRPWTLPLAAVLLVVLVAPLYPSREHLYVHPIQEDVVDYLAERGEPDAMLVPPYWDVGWLARTRHPIFADYQSAHHMTYMPQLAPSLKKMHHEVFGFVVDGDPGEPLAVWPERSPAEWRALAAKYGLDYILAPAEMPLQLEPVLEGHPYDLYRVAPE